MGFDLPCGCHNATYKQDITIIRTRARLIWTLFGLLFFFSLPYFAPVVITQILENIWVTAIAVMGLYLLTGLAGQISLGQAGFMGIGAYTTAIFADYFGLSFLFCIPLSGLMAGTMGIIFGLSSFKIKGFYIAIATLASQIILTWLFAHLEITQGAWGYAVSYPTIFGHEIGRGWPIYTFCLVVLLIMTYFAKNIARTKTGRAFVAIRDNDLAAKVQGINIFVYKLIAFFLCSFFAGVAGSVFAYRLGMVTPEQFMLMQSVWFLGMLIVGGMHSLAGVYLGTAFIIIFERMIKIIGPTLQNILPSAMGGSYIAALSLIVFAAIIIIFLIYEPRGLAHRWETIKSIYRIRPFPY